MPNIRGREQCELIASPTVDVFPTGILRKLLKSGEQGEAGWRSTGPTLEAVVADGPPPTPTPPPYRSDLSRADGPIHTNEFPRDVREVKGYINK